MHIDGDNSLNVKVNLIFSWLYFNLYSTRAENAFFSRLRGSCQAIGILAIGNVALFE